ncbi:MAG TPA: hypothetical protein VGQ83_42580 [Polyangia bacterium]|jgi:hypothetical protein
MANLLIRARRTARRARLRGAALVVLAGAGALGCGGDGGTNLANCRITGALTSTPRIGAAPLAVTNVLAVSGVGCDVSGQHAEKPLIGDSIHLALDFGDGKALALDPYVPGTPALHTYAASGTFTVRATGTVLNPHGDGTVITAWETEVEVN